MLSNAASDAMTAAPLRPPSGADLDHAHALVGDRWEELRHRHVFMTGGTGFVGKWLLATLLDANRRIDLDCRITLLTRDVDAFRRQAPWLANAPLVTLRAGDVRDFEFPNACIDHIVHAATDVFAETRSLDTFGTCVDGTRRVLDLALQSGAQSVLLVSSGAVYGRQPPTMAAIPELHPGAPALLATSTAYAVGKRAAEWLGYAYGAEHGLAVKIARCFAFVGPYLPLDKHLAIGNFLRDAMADTEVVVQGDGTPCRSYLHAADMAGWLWSILLRGKANHAYNVGSAQLISIADLARLIISVLGSDSAIRILSPAVPGRPVERYVPDVSRIRAELGLGSPIPLTEAIERTARWFRALV